MNPTTSLIKNFLNANWLRFENLPWDIQVAMFFQKYKPKKIKTVVIVNRDQTLFPVKIDFSGISLSTSVDETINLLIEKNGEINFYLS